MTRTWLVEAWPSESGLNWDSCLDCVFFAFGRFLAHHWFLLHLVSSSCYFYFCLREAELKFQSTAAFLLPHFLNLDVPFLLRFYLDLLF